VARSIAERLDAYLVGTNLPEDFDGARWTRSRRGTSPASSQDDSSRCPL
jgi:hypothetical protein